METAESVLIYSYKFHASLWWTAWKISCILVDIHRLWLHKFKSRSVFASFTLSRDSQKAYLGPRAAPFGKRRKSWRDSFLRKVLLNHYPPEFLKRVAGRQSQIRPKNGCHCNSETAISPAKVVAWWFGTFIIWRSASWPRSQWHFEYPGLERKGTEWHAFGEEVDYKSTYMVWCMYRLYVI